VRFQITTDYAIRIILYMAQQGVQVTTAKEVATRLGMTYNYFNKIAAKIKRLVWKRMDTAAEMLPHHVWCTEFLNLSSLKRLKC